MYTYRFYIGVRPMLLQHSEFIKELNNYTSGFTIIPTWGVWHGKLEISTVVEVVAESLPSETLARMAAEEFQQDSVLVTSFQSHGRLVTPPPIGQQVSKWYQCLRPGCVDGLAIHDTTIVWDKVKQSWEVGDEILQGQPRCSECGNYMEEQC